MVTVLGYYLIPRGRGPGLAALKIVLTVPWSPYINRGPPVWRQNLLRFPDENNQNSNQST